MKMKNKPCTRLSNTRRSAAQNGAEEKVARHFDGSRDFRRPDDSESHVFPKMAIIISARPVTCDSSPAFLEHDALEKIPLRQEMFLLVQNKKKKIMMSGFIDHRRPYQRPGESGETDFFTIISSIVEMFANVYAARQFLQTQTNLIVRRTAEWKSISCEHLVKRLLVRQKKRDVNEFSRLFMKIK